VKVNGINIKGARVFSARCALRVVSQPFDIYHTPYPFPDEMFSQLFCVVFKYFCGFNF